MALVEKYKKEEEISKPLGMAGNRGKKSPTETLLEKGILAFQPITICGMHIEY